jgi:hypothetical protein
MNVMEKIYKLPKHMPNKNDKIKYDINKTKSESIPIIRKTDDVIHEQFDPSSFSSSPPNSFLMCLRNRINTYN